MTNYSCLLKPSQLQSHRIPRLSKPLASVLLHRVVVLRLAPAPVSGGSCRRRAADPAGRARGPATDRPGRHACCFFGLCGIEASAVAVLLSARLGPSAARPCRHACCCFWVLLPPVRATAPVATLVVGLLSFRPRPCLCLMVLLCRLGRSSPARRRLDHGGSRLVMQKIIRRISLYLIAAQFHIRRLMRGHLGSTRDSAAGRH